jgi:hypothetical protein
MRIDLKQTKAIVLSPAEGQYKRRAALTLGELQALGFSGVQHHKSRLTPGSRRGGAEGFLRVFRDHLSACDQSSAFSPILVFEDDVSASAEATPDDFTVELPDSADALYVGISSVGIMRHRYYCCGTLKLRSTPGYPRLKQIFNMLSTHAILYTSRIFVQHLVQCFEYNVKHCADSITWDCFVARSQEKFEVYALTRPLFFQDHRKGGFEDQTKRTLDSRGDTVSDDEFDTWRERKTIHWAL